MSTSIGIFCLIIGIIALGIAFIKPAPERKRLRLQLFILSPVLIVFGVLILTGII